MPDVWGWLVFVGAFSLRTAQHLRRVLFIPGRINSHDAGRVAFAQKVLSSIFAPFHFLKAFMVRIAATIAPVFLVVFLGFVLGRTRIADERWTEVLNRLGLYVGFPALILHSLLQLHNIGELPVALLAVNAGVLAAAVLAVWLACTYIRAVRHLRTTYAIGVFFGNVAYLGFPIVTALLPGSEAVASASAAVYLAVLFTLGIALLEYERGGRSRPGDMLISIVKNPLLLAVLAGVAGVASGVTLPDILARPLAMLASTASPIVLIALGVFIATHSAGAVARRHALVISGLKLFVLPVVCAVVFAVIPTGGDTRIAVLQAAMPLGLTPFALTESYPLNRDIIASVIIMTTLLSAVTLAVAAALAGV